MTHQRNRQHLYKYLYQWKVDDDRSGFTHLNPNMYKEFGQRYIFQKDLDPIDYNELTAIRVQTLNNELPFTNKLGEQ